MTTGPSSSQRPYVLSSEPNVTITSILTTGDQVGFKPDLVTPWKMVGIPDGLGAFDLGNGKVVVLMNHELGNAAGVVREHGSVGAFVTKLIIDKATLTVEKGEDLAKEVWQDNDGDGIYTLATTAWNRFCSGDLAAQSAFYNPLTNLGTTDRIYLTGEEAGTEARGFAFVVTGAEAGKVFELPTVGNMSFENIVANPFSGNKTVAMMMDDSTPGQVYLYVGTKQATGDTIEKAGLTNGEFYGVRVTGLAAEANGTALTNDQAAFDLVQIANAKTKTGAQIETDSTAGGVTTFLRPEDGAWDPTHPNWFYFNTTNAFASPSRLWRLEFNDVSNPTTGGTIRMMLNGTEGFRMLDNMAVGADGNVYLVEDVGNNAYLGRVLRYDPVTDTLEELGIHDAARFGTPPTAPFNQDEEASGIIDVTSIFGNADRKAFLFDTQAHYAIAGELVEGGQLQVMYVDTPHNGGAGDDTINAGAGVDVLYGGGGNDTIRTGSGNDLISGDAGNDTIDGGIGSDKASFSGPHGDYDVRTFLSGGVLKTQVKHIGGLAIDGTDTLTSIEQLGFTGQTWGVAGAQQNHVSSVDGDRFDDVVLQSTTTGQVQFAKMLNGAVQSVAALTGTLGGAATWKAIASGDVNPSATLGGAEVFVQNQTSGTIYFASQDTGALTWGTVSAGLTSDWKLAAVADINGDASVDAVIQSQTSGTIYYANMAGGAFTGWGVVSAGLAANLQAVGAGDTNGDGFADVVVQSTTNGQIMIANMANGQLQGWSNAGGPLKSLPTDYQVKAVADLNGDGFADIVIQNQADGTAYFGDMAGGAFSGWKSVVQNPGTTWVVEGAADVNNDGYVDVLLQRQTDGLTYYAQMGAAGFDHFATVTTGLGADWHVV